MRPVILVIDDERGRRYYIRPVGEPPKVTRKGLVLKSGVAERCRECGEWADLCRCEEER